MKYITFSTIAIACATTFLGACSSSGGDGKATVPADAIEITEANALTTAKAGVSILEDASFVIEETLDNLLPVLAKTNNSATTRTRHFSDLARSIAANSKTSDVITNQATVNETLSCNSGTISVNGDYSGTATTETGNGTITFNNCSFAGSTINGVIKSSYTENLQSGLWSGSGTDSASNLTLIVNGITHEFNNFTDKWSYDDNTQIDEDESSFSLSSTTLGGGILYQDTKPWKWNYSDFDAFEGVTLITGAHNSKLRITALDSTQFQLEVDADGDGSFEFSQTFAWSILDNIGLAATISAVNSQDLAIAATESTKQAANTDKGSSFLFKTSSNLSSSDLILKQINEMVLQAQTLDSVCIGGGSISDNLVIDGTFISGPLTFTECDLGDGTVLNGNIIYSGTAENFTFTYSNFTVTSSGITESIDATIICTISSQTQSCEITTSITGIDGRTYSVSSPTVTGDEISGYSVTATVTDPTHGTITINATAVKFDCTSPILGRPSSGNITFTSNGKSGSVIFDSCSSYTVTVDGVANTYNW